MNRSLVRRLARLEASAPDPTIPIFVDDEADVGRRIDELIAEGELFEDERPRCVHWTQHKWPRPMRNEDRLHALTELAEDRRRREARVRGRAERKIQWCPSGPQSLTA